jgi:putative sigma-54 modulation protein
MTLTVTGRHVAVTDEHRGEIGRKLERLQRVLNDAALSAQVIVAQERSIVVCELTLHARGGHVLHGVGRHGSLARAAAAAVEKVEPQAKKLADRWKTRRKVGRGAARTPAVEAVAPAPPNVIRTRGPALKPMTLEDATLALGRQPFVIYRDAGSDRIAVLYRRPDGALGLVESED